MGEYPDIKDVKTNVARIRDEKYHSLAHFTLPKSSWIDNYYSPMEKRIIELKKKYRTNKVALQVVESTEREIKLYKRNSDYIGYEFFVMQKK